jgi:hypothetical protein
LIKHILILSLFSFLVAVGSASCKDKADLSERIRSELFPDTLKSWRGITPHIEGRVSGFDVAIDFEVLPAPLQPARAMMTLTVRTGKPEGIDQLLGIDFLYPKKKIRWLSEPSVRFPGLHQDGDVYTVPIEFVCLESGSYEINLWDINRTVGMLGVKNMMVGIGLDADGTLSDLMSAPNGVGHSHIETAFFDRDTVMITDGASGDSTSELFTTTTTVVPPFRIGEPSRVSLNLTFLRNLPDGFDLEFYYRYMDLSDLPKAVAGPVFAGQEMRLSMTVVPLPFREVHSVVLHIQPEGPQRRSFPWCVDALFNSDGTVHYIHNNLYLGESDQVERLLPKAYPPGPTSAIGSLQITRRK